MTDDAPRRALGRWRRGSCQRADEPDSLGSGEWQTMPGLGVRYMLFESGPDSYFVPSMRWALSSPTNPGQRRISDPQIAPTLNIDLPGPFFITFYPSHDIRINFGAPDSWSDRTAVPPLRCLDGRPINRQSATFARRQRANRKRISRLQLQKRGAPTDRVLKLPGGPNRARSRANPTIWKTANPVPYADANLRDEEESVMTRSP